MCIRDSADSLPPRRAYLAFSPPPPRASVWPSDATSLGFPSCLLYTSDAADERSSVDLGGRRIIKKKNRRELARSDSDTNTHTNKHARKVYHERTATKKREETADE